MDHPNPAVGNQDAEYGKWRLPRSEVPQQSLASDWLCMKPWLLEVPVVAIMITTFTTSSQPAPRKDCIEKKLSLSLHFLQGRHASHEPAAPSSKSGWSVWFETPGTSIYMQTAHPSIWADSWSAVFTPFCSGSTVLSNQINPNYVTYPQFVFLSVSRRAKERKICIGRGLLYRLAGQTSWNSGDRNQSLLHV